jgi:hypothetical protein
MEAGQKQEKVRLIEEAGECLKCGRTIRECKNDRLKKMMEKIAANAVCIGLYDFNKFVVGHIGEGNFKTIQKDWEKVRNELNRGLTIIDNKGENLNDILTVDEIEEAIRYTIFEQMQREENED